MHICSVSSFSLSPKPHSHPTANLFSDTSPGSQINITPSPDVPAFPYHSFLAIPIIFTPIIRTQAVSNRSVGLYKVVPLSVTPLTLAGHELTSS